jgi:pimeloyl-ACP methyl ester carboxylesterase
VTAALCGVLVLSACGAPPRAQTTRSLRHSSAASTTITTTTTTTTTPVSLPPVAPLSWSTCLGDLQCATLVVPLDYADLRGPTIPIAVARHPAEVPSARIGSLVIDPGGPGVSGVDDMANELRSLTPQLLDDFDIVTFDPRGVERSDPVTCGETPGSPPTTLPDPVPTTPAQVASTVAGLKLYAAACEKNSAIVLPHVGSVDAARDMEELRQALGDMGLTYMGQSYGTLLGLTYASMFPTHVRSMVLDGVIDPALTFNQMTLGQAQGFEAMLGSFFTWCAGVSAAACPWRPAGDPTQALLAQIAGSASAPVAAGAGRVAGAGELYDALLDGLYARSDWPRLGEALAADAAGNGAPVVAMSDRYNANGSTNGADAGVAIDCLDHPTSHDLAGYGYLAALAKASAPVFGPLLAWGQASCAVWPVPPTRVVGPVAAPGSPPILVVGTTADPATPYAWAVNVAHDLSRGVLLTRGGSDHVAYFYSDCVRSDVQAYLVGGATPPSGATCAS